MDVVTLQEKIENCLRAFMVHKQGCCPDTISMLASFMPLPLLWVLKDLLQEHLIYDPHAQLPNGFWILISGDLEASNQGMIRYSFCFLILELDARAQKPFVM